VEGAAENLKLIVPSFSGACILARNYDRPRSLFVFLAEGSTCPGCTIVGYKTASFTGLSEFANVAGEFQGSLLKRNDPFKKERASLLA
jgi:hypothetical protein